MIWLLSTAQAAGFVSSEGGLRATGRAGAVVAGADDLDALTYNPAALSRVRPGVGLQLSAVRQTVVFDRPDHDAVRNEAAPLPVPAVGVAFRPHERLTLALGARTPYAPRFAFPADGPQRFTLVDSVVLSGKVGPSAAFELGDLSLGAGLAWSFVQVQQSLVSHVAPLSFQADEDPAYDVLTSLDLVDPVELTWDAGVLWDRGRWALGASYTPPVRFEPRGSLTTDYSTNTYYVGDGPLGQVIAEATATDPDVTMAVVLPRVARLGVLVRPTETTEVELDATWQQWSSMPPMVVEDLDLVIETTQGEDVAITGDVTLPGELKDAFSLRLGGDWQARDRLTVRGGLSFESSGVAIEYRSVFLPDGPELGYGLGATWAATDSLALEAGWGQDFVFAHELDPSWVYQLQIDPTTGEVGSGRRVGEGSFRSSTMAAGVGLTWTPEGP